MIATPDQEVHMDRLSDDDRVLLDTILQEMRTEPNASRWTHPPSKLERARTAFLDGRVEEGDSPGKWHAHGTKRADGTIPEYTITDRCTCPRGTEFGDNKYCIHLTAVEIAKRYQAAKADQPQWPLFTGPPTVEERLAQPLDDDEQIPFTLSESTETSEEIPVERPSEHSFSIRPPDEDDGALLTAVEPPRRPMTETLDPWPAHAQPAPATRVEPLGGMEEDALSAVAGLASQETPPPPEAAWEPPATTEPVFVAQDRIERSPQVNHLMVALARAQQAMRNPTHDSLNPHLKNKYVSLAAIRDAIMPALTAEGIALTQLVSTEGSQVLCTTSLWHASGQYLCSTLRLPVAKTDAQGYGAAITYARRYHLMAICNVAGEEDDDGESLRSKEESTFSDFPDDMQQLAQSLGLRTTAHIEQRAGMRVTAANYAEITRRLAAIARRQPVS